MAEDKKEAKIVEVPTSNIEFIELPDGRRVTDRQMLIEIYNQLQKMEKKL